MHDWVSGQAARCRDELIRMNAERRERTGEDYYLYTSRPGDGQTRVVFQDGTEHGYAAGLRHMQARIARDEVEARKAADDATAGSVR